MEIVNGSHGSREAKMLEIYPLNTGNQSSRSRSPACIP
jgi:hypothetical protein